MVLLDIFFTVLHIFVISVNLFAWMWKPLRSLHITVLTLTLVSWLGFGMWYGLGYCFLTDWHWDVKRSLGETSLPTSFIQYYVEKFGIGVSPETTDLVVAILFGIVVLISLYIYIIRPLIDYKHLTSRT
jgi:energy-coupling factor transporter transmembrane protein EcfT